MKIIRIFISSPGDVQPEREIARKVVSELNQLYARHVTIETVMWEDLPLSAHATFQEGIDIFLKGEPIDFAVFILWSRLGTPLSQNFTRPDGTPYRSGTEYEFDLMSELRLQMGHPQILAYVKTQVPDLRSADVGEWIERTNQRKLLKDFIQTRFNDEESNSHYAYMEFDNEVAFEKKFRTHLMTLVRKELIGEEGVKEWNGNPYVGLNSYEYEQGQIFFGREQLIYETLQNLKKDDGLHGLIVLGESGSGKSSFVKAGLLPMLCGDKQRDYCILSPSKFAGEMYSGLIDVLIEKYDFLQDDPFIEQLKVKIDKETDFEYLSEVIRKNNGREMIFYIDQFEELFTDAHITKEEQQRVTALLNGLASTQSMALFVSMRIDFYGRLFSSEGLKSFKNNSKEVVLSSMGMEEIKEVVERPAEKACLKWEIGSEGRSLSEQIVNDAAGIKDLPLIEFALSELYNKRDENDCLTFHSYREIGGMKGAIVEYAGKFYNSLNKEEKEALSDLLGYVIANQRGRFVRKTSLQNDTPQDDVHQAVIKKLVDAHIFVTGKDYQNNSTITIVHEILIEQWDVISKWITEKADFLHSNTYYEHRANRWISNEKSPKDLIYDREALLEAEYFVYKYNKLMGGDTRKFLLTSLKKDVRKNVVWQSSFVGLLVVIFLFLSQVINLDIEYSFRDFYRNIIYALYIGLVVFIPVLGFDAVLKLRGELVFKTIKGSFIFWLVPALLAVILIMYEGIDIGVLIFATPVLVKLLSQLRDWWIRHKWKKVKMVKYNILDRILYRCTSIMLISFLLLFGVCYVVLSIEELDDTTVVVDELFDGLNNIESQLSYSDVYYINSERKKYIEKYFSETLTDSATIDQRELQYATSLYNLAKPDSAICYLNPDLIWPHHLLCIKCYMAMGEYLLAEKLLEKYVLADDEDGKYMDWGVVKTGDLIWIAEKLGRFDLANELFQFLERSNVDLTMVPYVINRGHIYLAERDVEKALKYYQNVIDKDTLSKSYIMQDLHTFSYYETIDDKLLQTVGDRLNIQFIPAFTQNDTLFTSHVYEQLQGVWVNTSYENGITYKRLITIDPEKLFVTIDVLENGEILYTSISHIRFERTSDGIIWDEYDPQNDTNSYGLLENIEGDTFSIRVIENGYKEMQGEKLVYTRV